MVWFWDHYAPEQASRQNADASPSKAADLSGLPPAVVLTAEHDVLRQEGEDYADALRAAGVEVHSRRFEGQMHGFFTLVNVLPASAAGIDHVSAAVDRLLTRGTRHDDQDGGRGDGRRGACPASTRCTSCGGWA
jgi:acetyl esterase